MPPGPVDADGAPDVSEQEAAGQSLTVVVATRDRPAMLAATLDALGSACRPEDRVVVVDSASVSVSPTVGEVVGARRAGVGVELVRCEEPGTSRARNAGWRSARTDLVAFTDDDCRPQPGWAAALAAAMAGPGRPDFVTGRVVAAPMPGSPRAGVARLALSLLESTEPQRFDRTADPSLIGHGANMAWRRRALERLGGFDEQLGPGAALRAAEDHDLFWRALATGSTGRYEPRALVEHVQWRSRRHQLAAMRAYGVGSGAVAVKQWRLGGSPDEAPDGTPDRPPDEAGAGVGGGVGWQSAEARQLARLVIGPVVWRSGVLPVARQLRQGYEMGALAELAKSVGAVEGVWRARRWELRDGRFSAPRD